VRNDKGTELLWMETAQKLSSNKKTFLIQFLGCFLFYFYFEKGWIVVSEYKIHFSLSYYNKYDKFSQELLDSHAFLFTQLMSFVHKCAMCIEMLRKEWEGKDWTWKTWVKHFVPESLAEFFTSFFGIWNSTKRWQLNCIVYLCL